MDAVDECMISKAVGTVCVKCPQEQECLEVCPDIQDYVAYLERKLKEKG